MGLAVSREFGVIGRSERECASRAVGEMAGEGGRE